jgi:XTP/dITP diphosphohydrolase
MLGGRRAGRGPGHGRARELLAGQSWTRCSTWRSEGRSAAARCSRRRWRGARRETAGAGDGEPPQGGGAGGDAGGGGLALDGEPASELGPAPVIVEDQDSFVAHAALKARGIAGWLAGAGEPGDTLVLADDSGVCVDALDGAPGCRLGGVRGAAGGRRGQQRAAAGGAGGPRARSLGGALRVRAGAAPGRRGAAGGPGAEPRGRARTCCSLGRWHGEIRRERRGAGGFGYDPHFWIAGPEGATTVASLAPPRRTRARTAGRRRRCWRRCRWARGAR